MHYQDTLSAWFVVPMSCSVLSLLFVVCLPWSEPEASGRTDRMGNKTSKPDTPLSCVLNSEKLYPFFFLTLSSYSHRIMTIPSPKTVSALSVNSSVLFWVSNDPQSVRLTLKWHGQ